jgi:hypothetical protein
VIEMSGAAVLAGRLARGTVRDMFSPNVIEIRRGSAHCLAADGLAMRPASSPARHTSPSGAAQPAAHHAARPVMERVA